MDDSFGHTNIEYDAFDEAIFRGLVETVPELERLARRGGNLLPGWEACLFDIFCAAFKLNVRLSPAASVPSSRRFHRKVVEDLLVGEAFRRVRRESVIDEARAAMVALVVGEALLGEIKEESLLIPRELRDLWELSLIEARREERAEQRETAEAWGERSEVFAGEARRLAEEIEREEAAERALAGEAARSAEDLPLALASRLQAEADSVAMSLESFEEAHASFARTVGLPARLSPGERLTLALHLRRNRKLHKLAAYIGRMRAQARAVRTARIAHGSGELHRITLGDELSRLIPSELAMLRHPLLRRDFSRRLLERRLLSYEIESPERQGRGPMIVLIDGSGSMAGERDLWAKALALTLLHLARRQRRRYVAISFASAETPLRLFPFDGPLRPRALVEFADHFPGGGTDFAKPLGRALEFLRESRYRRGDIVLVTDGACRVPEPWLREFLAEKKRLEFSVFSLLIETGEEAVAGVRAFSDRITTVRHLQDEAIGEIFLET